MNPAEQRLKDIQTTLSEIDKRLKKLKAHKKALETEQKNLLRQLL